MRQAGDARLAALVAQRLAATAAHAADAHLTADGRLTAATASAASTPTGAGGPRRRVIPPVDGDTFRSLTGDDRAWYDGERDKLDDLGDAITETISLLDGKRSPAELADALSLSLGRPVPEAWVRHLLAILAKLDVAR